MNQEQIKNPHRIYPGDVIVLDRSGAEPRLRLVQGGQSGESGQSAGQNQTVKLSPRMRAEPIQDAAVPAIAPSAIEPFLTRPLVVGATELDSAPFILATQENRVALGAGNVAYVEGLKPEMGRSWQLFRRADALVDPETNEILGYQATYLGEARVVKFGPQSTVEIVKSNQEIYAGDRLLSTAREKPTFSYVPRSPQGKIRARIMSTYGNLGETGPSGIVALSKGAKDGLEVGHVLAIYRSQSTSRYEIRNSALYGREGLTGNERPRTYHEEQISPRDGPYYDTTQALSPADVAKLPDERYGLVMVFRTFDRTAFGIVMRASRQVAVNDLLTNP